MGKHVCSKRLRPSGLNGEPNTDHAAISIDAHETNRERYGGAVFTGFSFYVSSGGECLLRTRTKIYGRVNVSDQIAPVPDHTNQKEVDVVSVASGIRTATFCKSSNYLS